MSNFQIILGSSFVPPKNYDLNQAQELPKTELQFIDSPNLNLDDTENVQAISWLGTPIRDRLTLKNSNIMIILDAVLMTVSRTKNIVKTIISGNSGSFKEWVNDDDFQISISGFICGRNKYPKDEVIAFLQLMESNEPLSCQSQFMDLFGIYFIIVEEFKLPISEGWDNIQAFDFTACSDKPLEFLTDV